MVKETWLTKHGQRGRRPLTSASLLTLVLGDSTLSQPPPESLCVEV